MNYFKLKYYRPIALISIFLFNTAQADPYIYNCSCTPVGGGCPGSGLDSSIKCCRCYSPESGKTPTFQPNSNNPNQSSTITVPAGSSIYVNAYCMDSTALAGPGEYHMNITGEHVSHDNTCPNSDNKSGISPSYSTYQCTATNDTDSGSVTVNEYDCFTQSY